MIKSKMVIDELLRIDKDLNVKDFTKDTLKLLIFENDKLTIIKNIIPKILENHLDVKIEITGKSVVLELDAYYGSQFYYMLTEMNSIGECA